MNAGTLRIGSTGMANNVFPQKPQTTPNHHRPLVDGSDFRLDVRKIRAADMSDFPLDPRDPLR